VTRMPDFMIVGAPKSGTSALHVYLRAHPDIFMPELELNFFGSDLKTQWPTLEEYLYEFSRAKHERRVGEKSVWYLYSKRAAEEIKESCPSVNIIIMLRNPIDMLESLHSELVYHLQEDIIDFDAALAAEADRRRGMRLPKDLTYPIQCLFYSEIARYPEQVEKYFRVFGRENVRIILLDDLKADTAGVYENTLRFLGVNADFRPSFEIINANKRPRSKILMRLLEKRPRVYNLIPLPVRARLRVSVIKGIERLNNRYEQRPRMNQEQRECLQAELAPQVERLSQLLDRDLSHWV